MNSEPSKKRNRNTKIHYKTEVIEEADGYNRPIRSFKSVTSDCVKRYRGTTNITMDFDGATRNLLDYLTETMSIGNHVTNSVLNRQFFINHVKKYSNITYSDNTVKQAFSKLVASGILRKIEKGKLQVHPAYFFRGKETDRESILKTIFLEDAQKGNLKGHEPRKRWVKKDLMQSF
jgi:hypothetical protein